MAFKDRLKEARLNNGLTQEQVAERIGVAKSTFTGYEKGNSEPNMYTISQIMNVLKVDANFLWQDEMDALGGNPAQLKYNEMKHMEKYRSLDDPGRSHVDTVLQWEADRIGQIADLKSRSASIKEYPSLVRDPDAEEYPSLVRDPDAAYLTVDAAHARTDIDIPEGTDTSDDDIMNDPNF